MRSPMLGTGYLILAGEGILPLTFHRQITTHDKYCISFECRECLCMANVIKKEIFNYLCLHPILFLNKFNYKKMFDHLSTCSYIIDCPSIHPSVHHTLLAWVISQRVVELLHFRIIVRSSLKRFISGVYDQKDRLDRMKDLRQEARLVLKPSHTGGKTGCGPPTTKKVADHQRSAATIGPPPNIAVTRICDR